MKITQSALHTESAAAHYRRTRQEENLRMEVTMPARAAATDTVSVSDTGRATQSSESAACEERPELAGLDPRLRVLIGVIEALTGRRVRFYTGEKQASGQVATQAPTSTAADQPPAARRTPDISIRYDFREIREEAEVASFRAAGTVQTSDGRSIRFDLALEMARYERTESTLSIEAGTPRRKDPLVLNLGTDRVRLETGRFDFDLDADGESESVARLGSGSAFLALDRNRNDAIDDGTELFGAQSGDGFADLAALDDDGNGWIDEGDAAFAQLRLWRPDETATTLAEAGVGAIALERRATPFTLKDAAGNTAGEVRTTGIYLKEDGGVGTAQQIDLVV